MQKNNINFFTWENSIFLNKDLNRWIEHFIEKHWEFNISRVNKENLEKINLEWELTTPPFLAEFRLIILNWLPSAASANDSWDEILEHKKNVDDEILKILEMIPDKNIVIFVQENPDKRKWLYKKLKEVAVVKEFNNLDEHELKNYIRTVLVWIDSQAADRLIQYKWLDMRKIENEIEKLALFRSNDRITVEDIEKYVIPEIEVSIFKFMDRIYELNYTKAIQGFREVLENSKIEPTVAGIMTNLRKFIYVNQLKNSWVQDKDIIDRLKIHPFVFQKITQFKKNLPEIIDIYNRLSAIDIKAKIWELPGDIDESLRLAIEKVILDLKNKKNTLEYARFKN
jgi:DNA polymerase III delta subunit